MEKQLPDAPRLSPDPLLNGRCKMFSLRTLFLCLSIGCLSASSAHAALIINFSQVGSDVVGTLSGSLNVSGILQLDQGNLAGGYRVRPSNGFIMIAPSVGNTWSRLYGAMDSPAALIFGTGPSVDAEVGLGDFFSLSATDHYFTLPFGYLGGPLNGTVMFLNQSIVSLGMTPGVYTSTIGGGQDSITIRVNASSVPEPDTVSLMTFALAAVGFHTWRRRRVELS